MNRVILGLIFIASLINFYLIKIIYDSYVNQKFLSEVYYEIAEDYTNEDILSVNSSLPNITVSTVPIEILKAQLLLNNGYGNESDILLKMIDQGEKANPYLQYSNSLRAIYYANKKNFDSLKKYSKIAYYNMPNHTLHYNIYLDVIEFKKDSLELKKAFKEIKNPRLEFTKRYLKSLTKIKSRFSETDKIFVDSINTNLGNNKYLGLYSKLFSVGKENVYEGYNLSKQAKEFFNKQDFLNAGIYYEDASKSNPIENSYYENAANSYMQAGKDDKAIEILIEQLNKLNPQTGKSEYLLGIIYIGKKENKSGCEYLHKSKEKGFVIPKEIFNTFCN